MKLLVTDYDNTYDLHYEKYDTESIFRNNYRAVDKFMKKHKFVISTGRHFDTIYSTIKEKNLKFDYLSVNNGSELYDSSLNLIYVDKIDDNVVAFIKKLKNQKYIRYFTPKNSLLITSINMYIYDLEEFNKVKNNLNNIIDKCKIQFKFPKIKILSKTCNKVNTIKVLEKIEKDITDIYTIGDDICDLEMILEYNGYSLTSANKIVKNNAKKCYKNLYNLIYDII